MKKVQGRISYSSKRVGKQLPPFGIMLKGAEKPLYIPLSFKMDLAYRNKKCTGFFEKEALVKLEIYIGEEIITLESDKEYYIQLQLRAFNDEYDELLERSKSYDDLFSVEQTKLPSELKRELQVIDFKPDNYELKLNQYAYYNQKDEKFTFCQTDQRELRFIKPEFGEFDFVALCKRHLQSAQDVCNEQLLTQVFLPQNKLTLGFGEPTVYNTSITLHPVYGIPYVSGSAFKGVIRNYVIEKLFEKEETEALMEKDFVALFGNTEQQGSLIFFDAYPTREPCIMVDVFTPHYKKFKLNGTAPADYHEPEPLHFLVVKRTPFQFMIGSKVPTQNPYHTLLKNTCLKDWVEQALLKNGLGAKTALGDYGHFELYPSSQI